MNNKYTVLLILPLLILIGCDDEPETSFDNLPKQVSVFGVKIAATENVPDAKVLHAANVLAQYLYNDANGTVDNQTVVDKMVAANATLIMMNTEDEGDSFDWDSIPDGTEVQDLFGFETHPDFHPETDYDPFDATLEEVLHLVTHVGYARAYSTVFGEEVGTSIANAMDIARGGQFTSIPSEYPSSAWYTYDDDSCDYSCMVTEYFYWSLTSILGAQKNRTDEISEEWQLNTKALVMDKDNAIYTLLTNSEYSLPVTLPDGNYEGFDITLD